MKALLFGLVLVALALGGCSSVAQHRYDDTGTRASPSQSAVDSCTPLAHLKCIHLTGRETLADGAQLQWTRHWWRMSYIGRACETRYGRTTSVILEGLFAIPHYTAIAFGNTIATLAYPFRRSHDDETDSGD